MTQYIKIGLIYLFSISIGMAQAPVKKTSADILHDIQKLQFLGTALYIAAHPDDENTRLIAYLSNHLKANTAYLSLTRGDGGQNLIGTELQEKLGVLRTQELLGARSIDGGKQFFSRANDFGYSKHPDETLEMWNKSEVLSDVITTIRKFKPDIIVNRFDHRTPGRTHGHHTSSAMLSVEAFEKAANKNIMPESARQFGTWQVQRQFFNTSWWFYGSQEKFQKADKSNMLSVDVGVYYPLKGKSNTEIAAEARSMHKCQGFGSTGTRGSTLEYLELINGDLPVDKTNLFDGIETSWRRVKGGAPIAEALHMLEDNFEFTNPAASVDELLKVRTMISKVNDEHWKTIKLEELDQILTACMGLYIEAKANKESATKGQTVELAIEAVNRSHVEAEIISIKIVPSGLDTIVNLPLKNNEISQAYYNYVIENDGSYTSPYWLLEKGTLGMYHVENKALIGSPETSSPVQARIHAKVAGQDINFTRNVIYKKNDPVDGEVYKPFIIVPKVSTNLPEKVYIFNSTRPKDITVTVKALDDELTGTVELCHPDSWNVTPKKYDFSFKNKGADQNFSFTVTPPEGQDENFIVPLVKIGEESFTDDVFEIDYDHIPRQVIVQDASSKVVKLDISKRGKSVAYIMGAGDEVPKGLEQIGYEVTEIEIPQIRAGSLDGYDAVLVGIRAYNTKADLKFKQDILLDYVKAGGNLILQYNTSRRFNMENIGPYPLSLSRDRVTDEHSEVRFINPEHPVLNKPNKITAADFTNWVQERGLYFPGEWDERYDAILSMNDKGEDPKNGSLLVTKYGEGYYVYTGISFFRELPAGVPGAFRLLANLISLGKELKP